MIEPVIWRNGVMSRETDDMVRATVIAHDLGAPLLKVPVPEVSPGELRVEAVDARGGQRGGPGAVSRGAARSGMAGPSWRRPATSWPGEGRAWRVGRAILEEPSPSEAARRLAAVVHGG